MIRCFDLGATMRRNLFLVETTDTMTLSSLVSAKCCVVCFSLLILKSRKEK